MMFKPRLIWIRVRGWLGDGKLVRRQVTWAELAVLEAFLSVVVPVDKFAGEDEEMRAKGCLSDTLLSHLNWGVER